MGGELHAPKYAPFHLRRVQKLCEENRIPGVSKIGYMWLIPKDSEKPIDGRLKENKC